MAGRKDVQISKPEGFDPSEFTDEWAKIQAATLQRDREQQSLDAQTRVREIEVRDARRRWVWEGVAIAAGVLLFAALLAGGVLLVWKVDRDNDQRQILLERERTKQVAECSRYEDPSERGFCMMRVGGEEED